LRVSISSVTTVVRACTQHRSFCQSSWMKQIELLPIFSTAVRAVTRAPQWISRLKSTFRFTTMVGTRDPSSSRNSAARPSASQTGITVLLIWPRISVSLKRGLMDASKKARMVLSS
jgi:hypothetical protein